MQEGIEWFMTCRQIGGEYAGGHGGSTQVELDTSSMKGFEVFRESTSATVTDDLIDEYLCDT